MKRTERIDRDREHQIGVTFDGQPVWTTVGSSKLTPDQAHELSHNLAAQQRYAAIQQVTLKVLEASCGFFDSIALNAAPARIADLLQRPDDQLTTEDKQEIVDWLVNSGFKHHWDGLTFVVTYRGTEVARTTASVPAWMQLEVLAALQTDRMMVNAKN